MRWFRCLLLHIDILVLASVLHYSDSQQTGSNKCATMETCHECIRTPECAWCKQLNFTEQTRANERCNTIEELKKEECPEEDIIFPKNKEKIIKDEELSIYKNASSETIVQIKPQHVSLKLRVGEEHSLKVTFGETEDYPLDLYYLMDLSNSMSDDKDNLAKLGNSISEKMKSLTSKFKLGFGSFVDKVVMPYVNTVPKMLETPCSGCVTPYGFINHMPLSSESEEFENKVNEAKVSANMDNPEGGFDALMQAMVCHKEIGWRKIARHLLVFATDESFHIAGDGKLGGIVTPNDAQCHMEDNQYTHSLVVDYPSVSMINKIARATKTHVIFAVTEAQKKIYKDLTTLVSGSTLGIILKNSSNIVDLIEKSYMEIQGSVQLGEKGSSEEVVVEFYSNCGKEDAKIVQTNKCGGLEPKQAVEFEGRIKVNRAPSDPDRWKQQIIIDPFLGSEKLTIDLEIIADCDCEHEGNSGYIPNSEQCNEHGSMQCAACICDDKHFGSICECTKDSVEENEADIENCKAQDTDIICSNQGLCECGQCQCYEADDQGHKYSGKYCQCDDYSCKQVNGKLCSGPGQGECVCGQCKCKQGWTGKACQCPKSDDMCYRKGDSSPCSGRGVCACGKCECHETKHGRYRGTYCEQEPSFAGLCKDLLPCVECKVFEKEYKYCDDDTVCYFEIEEKKTVKAEAGQQECTFTDEDDCFITFIYGMVENEDKTKDRQLKVWVQTEKECRMPLSILAILAIVIGAVVGIGIIALILWKLFTMIIDHREYMRFEKEKEKAKWDKNTNPIYKNPVTVTTNPMFNKKGN